MKKKNGQVVAVMANQVARARHALKVQEQRLFLWLVGEVDPYLDSEFPMVRLSVADYAALFGRQRQSSMYAEMEEMTDGLMTKVLEIRVPDENSRKKFQWVSYAEYMDGQGEVSIQLHEKLKPFLLALKKEFAQVPLREVMSLRSRYAISFFQMCCSWDRASSRSWTMTVEELREWLAIEEEEYTSGDLRTWVIDRARKELNERTSLSFKVEAIRSGRRVAGWKFVVVDNRPKKRPEGAVGLPEAAKAEDDRLRSERQERAKIRWMEASEEQRARWLGEMNSVERDLAPGNGTEPRPSFLECLAFRIFEPELPGMAPVSRGMQ